MDDTSICVKKPVVLLTSLALNIFLVAFLLGRCSTHPMMPPPFMGGHSPGGFGMHGDMPPPPLFFGPEALFSPQEMQKNFSVMQNSFEKGQKLRKEFAAQLKKGPVTKEQVLKHFSELDQTMNDVKGQMQEKAADKISSMSQEEREEFADHLLKRRF